MLDVAATGNLSTSHLQARYAPNEPTSMNAPATTMDSNATMNPPVARNQEKNDAMSAAAAVALTGLQSVSTTSSTGDNSNNGSKSGSGKKSKNTGKKDEAVALEVSKTFPQIVSFCCRLDVDGPSPKSGFAFFGRVIHGPAQALFSVHFRHVMCLAIYLITGCNKYIYSHDIISSRTHISY